MKSTLQRMLDKFRQANRPANPAGRLRAADASETEAPGAAAPTGETIFGDHALRFRSLSLNAADLSALEHPSQLRGGFKIRVAKRPGPRRHAKKLVEKRYVERGYTMPYVELDPNLSTFLAYDEGLLVGTVSVRLDSKKRLSADELYGVELDAMRNAGCGLCEFTRLAVDKAASSKPVLAGLFHTAFLYAAVIRGFTHAIIEVNPRHVTFYRKALSFEPIGPERMNLRVHAPAVLLCVPFATIAEGLRKHAGKPAAPGAARSLFQYGFPEDEEIGVLGRLRELVAPQ